MDNINNIVYLLTSLSDSIQAVGLDSKYEREILLSALHKLCNDLNIVDSDYHYVVEYIGKHTSLIDFDC